jgi:hypothetical protein
LRKCDPFDIDQRHIGRVLRSSRNAPGRRDFSSRGRELRAGRCPFARTIGAAKKYVVSSTLGAVDWNAELLRGDLGKAIVQLKQQAGKGLFVAA